MTNYTYKVRDAEGQLLTGTTMADSLSAVAARLHRMGYAPIDITAESSINLRREIEIPGFTDRVSLKEVAIVSRQLSTMVSTGLSLVRALGVLEGQVQSKKLAATIGAVRSDVERGSSLSSALEEHPKVFNQLYIAMVRAGEASGQLDSVLLKLASTLEHHVQLRAKVRSAMTYPAVICSVVVIIVAAMMIIVVPTFKHLYTTLKGKLPLPTQIVVHISNVLASVWLVVVIFVIIGIVAALRRFVHTERGREIWDRFKLRPPIFGPLNKKIAISRLSGTLSSLLAAGVGIIESLDIAAANAGNRLISDAIGGAKAAVREGRSLGVALSAYDVIPTMVTQMIETGEQAGAVDEMLAKIEEFYDSEIETTVANLSALLEPVIIVFMGICVGSIIVSLYLPMFDYVKLLTPGS